MNIPFDEKDLVNRCAAGQPSAQSRLVEMYQSEMMFYVRSYISNEEDAAEVLFGAFHKCLARISAFEYQGPGSLKAWLKKIVSRECLMHYRQSDSPPAEEITETLEEEFAIGIDYSAIGKMGADSILRAFRRLPDGYRQVMSMYVFEQASHKQIAKALEISTGTSKTQLKKGKKYLKRLLKSDYENELRSWKTN